MTTFHDFCTSLSGRNAFYARSRLHMRAGEGKEERSPAWQQWCLAGWTHTVQWAAALAGQASWLLPPSQHSGLGHSTCCGSAISTPTCWSLPGMEVLSKLRLEGYCCGRPGGAQGYTNAWLYWADASLFTLITVQVHKTLSDFELREEYLANQGKTILKEDITFCKL